MKKQDREKLDIEIEKLVNAHKYCFNSEYTNSYLTRFAHMKFESFIYSDSLAHLNLEIMHGIDIIDDKIQDKKVEEEIREYFVKCFKRRMKEILPVYFEELTKAKKAEKDKENEAKGKKSKK